MTDTLQAKRKDQLLDSRKPGTATFGLASTTAADIHAILVLPQAYESHRSEVADAVKKALTIVRDFAARHGWSACMKEPFFNAVEIYRSQDALWQRILDLNEAPAGPMPTDALVGALEKGVLLALVREEAERARPEYFRAEDDWTRLLAHEIVHRLHERIVDGKPEAMGPLWFFEGLAVLGSGQQLGGDVEITDLETALKFTQATGRGSYARYAAALRFFLDHIPLPQLVTRAATPDFQEWLRKEVLLTRSGNG